MDKLITLIEVAGKLGSYFLIFCILSSMIAPLLGFSYGKFYSFVNRMSEKVYRIIRPKINYRYREYVPFISLMSLYLIAYIFFTANYFSGVLVSGSGVFYLLNFEFLGFLHHCARVTLNFSDSLLNFFIFVFIIKAILNFTNNRNLRIYYIFSNITRIITLRIRGYLYKLKLENYEEIVSIGILIILKLMISSLYSLL